MFNESCCSGKPPKGHCRVAGAGNQTQKSFKIKETNGSVHSPVIGSSTFLFNQLTECSMKLSRYSDYSGPDMQ